MSAFTDLLDPAGGRVLVVTNDFPPRVGGIQTFVRQLVGELSPDQVVVHASSHPEAGAYDSDQPFVVVRDRANVLLPTRRTARRVMDTMRAHGCTQVLYGAAAPLALMAPALSRAGARHQVALTHGHEVWWAALPPTRTALRRIGEAVDVLTYVSDYTRRRIEPALSDAGRSRFVRLSPEIDRSRFHPGQDGTAVRRAIGIPPDALVVVSVGRLVRRKGQLDLVRVWPKVLRRFPGAHLVVVGEGPDENRLRALVLRLGIVDTVHLVGRVPDVVPYLAAGDVFASPSRERWFGLEIEAFGIVYAEAAAMGLKTVGTGPGGTSEAITSKNAEGPRD